MKKRIKLVDKFKKPIEPVVLRSEDLCTKGDPICYRVDDLTDLNGTVVGVDRAEAHEGVAVIKEA